MGCGIWLDCGAFQDFPEVFGRQRARRGESIFEYEIWDAMDVELCGFFFVVSHFIRESFRIQDIAYDLGFQSCLSADFSQHALVCQIQVVSEKRFKKRFIKLFGDPLVSCGQSELHQAVGIESIGVLRSGQIEVKPFRASKRRYVLHLRRRLRNWHPVFFGDMGDGIRFRLFR